MQPYLLIFLYWKLPTKNLHDTSCGNIQSLEYQSKDAMNFRRVNVVKVNSDKVCAGKKSENSPCYAKKQYKIVKNKWVRFRKDEMYATVFIRGVRTDS